MTGSNKLTLFERWVALMANAFEAARGDNEVFQKKINEVKCWLDEPNRLDVFCE